MNLRNTLTRGFLALAGSLCIATHAFAAAPMQWTEAPGFYRIALGQFEVTALSDGTISLPLDRLLANITADRAREALASRFQSVSSETSVNAFLVNTGERLVLIDAGDPAGLRPGLGKLVANLRAAGYEPEQVDDVLITHMHRDHVGGLSTGGKATFPNATIHLAAHEAAYWLDDNNKAAAPKKTSGVSSTSLQKPCAHTLPPKNSRRSMVTWRSCAASPLGSRQVTRRATPPSS